MKRRIHSLGRVPRIAWSCRIGKRQAARNALGNVLRAIRRGNCGRARHIMEDYSFRSATGCVDWRTLERVTRRMEDCKEK